MRCLQAAGQTGGPGRFIQSRPIMTWGSRDESGREEEKKKSNSRFFISEKPSSSADSFLFQGRELSPESSLFFNILQRHVASQRTEVTKGRGPASRSTATSRRRREESEEGGVD